MTAVFDNHRQREAVTDNRARSMSIGSRSSDLLAKVALGIGIVMTLSWMAFLAWCLNRILDLI
jgi:hypothetical protein